MIRFVFEVQEAVACMSLVEVSRIPFIVTPAIYLPWFNFFTLACQWSKSVENHSVLVLAFHVSWDMQNIYTCARLDCIGTPWAWELNACQRRVMHCRGLLIWGSRCIVVQRFLPSWGLSNGVTLCLYVAPLMLTINQHVMVMIFWPWIRLCSDFLNAIEHVVFLNSSMQCSWFWACSILNFLCASGRDLTLDIFREVC